MSLLTNSEAADAARYNIRKARSVGWIERWSDCAGILNLPQATLTAPQFAQLVADWQDRQDGLDVDGKLGNNSWRLMRRSATQSYPRRPVPGWLLAAPGSSPVGSGGRGRRIAADSTIAAGGSEAPWIDVARAQMNTHWRNSGGMVFEDAPNQNIDEDYFQATPKWGGTAHTLGTQRTRQNSHWCAAFVNYCLHTAGYSHTGSAGAASFARRGWHFKALPEPKRGCVIVLRDTSHVGFLDRWTDLPKNPRGDVRGSLRNGVYLLGGNQSNTICSKLYARDLVAARDRRGNRSPYLWPEVGSGNCNCDLPTARPHHCGIRWL